MKKESGQDPLDVAADKPKIPIPITWAGITRQQVYLRLNDELSRRRKEMSLLCDLDVYLSLPETRRGIHTSRIEKEIHELCTSVHASVEDFCCLLAERSYYSQECKGSRVLARASYVRPTKVDQDIVVSEQPISILSDVCFDGQSSCGKLGIEVPFLIACPCVQRYFQHLTHSHGRGGEEIGADFTSSELSGLVTHTQRATAVVWVDNPRHTVRLKDLIKLADSCLTPVSSMLKRPDERKIVLQALKEARFIEDVSRELAVTAYKMLKHKLQIESKIDITVVSIESIHPYNLVSKLSVSVNDLEQILSRPDVPN